LPGFIHRTQSYMQAAAAAAKGWYDDAGQWISPGLPAATRERFWIAFALYADGSAALANAVIAAGESPHYGDVLYNIFDTNIAVALLVAHRDAMSPPVVAQLERLARDGFSFKPGNRQPDYQFHGYNDNMPAEATLGLVLGGELLDNADAVAYGLWNLRQLRALLVRRGINSEFNSPTYSPLTIHAMSAIAQHAHNEEARELALGIERRLWLDAAARFHLPTGVVAGPYSRAYTVDTLGHLSLMASLLWFVIGDSARPSPLCLFEEHPDLVFHHAQDIPFNISQMSWLAAGHYHIDQPTLDLFTKKKLPFHIVAGTEAGDFGIDCPAAPLRTESLLCEDYTVATSDCPFLTGTQTMSYFATYKRRDHVKGAGDVGTIFSKMVLDDDVPGKQATHTATQTLSDGRVTKHAVHGEDDIVASCANAITVQAASTVMLLTHPQLALGGSTDRGGAGGTSAGADRAPRPISRLSDLVIFPSHQGGADEILVGGQARSLWQGALKHGQWLVCRRGHLFIGVRPLAFIGTSLQGTGEVRFELERVNNYEVLRTLFYAGAERTFSRAELAAMSGGFVAEHAAVSEFPSIAAFAASLEQSRFTDYYWMTRRSRYRRPQSPQRPALDIEVSWSAGALHPRYASIDGRVVTTPVLQIDGIDNAAVPFLNEPYRAVPPFFPWPNFDIEWSAVPYGIGDRESD
jgi:hypothetical protein